MRELSESLILGFIGRIWGLVLAAFRDSAVGRLLKRLGRPVRESMLRHILIRDSALDRAMEGSLLLRWLEALLMLPVTVIRRPDSRLRRGFTESLLVRFAGWLGRCAPLLLGLLLTGMLVTPYERWNNAYALLGALAILFLFWAAALLDGRRIRLRDVGAWPLLFAAVCIASLFWSRSIWLGWRYLAFAVTCMLLVLLLVTTVENEKQLARILLCCAVGLGICCLYAVYQRIIGVEASASFTDLEANAGMPGRVFSFFNNPNAYANVLVFFAPLMLSMALFCPKWYGRLFYLGVFGLAALALIMTYSRGGWLALAISVGVMLLILCPRYVPPLFFAALATIPAWPYNIRHRLLTIFTRDSSISSRSYIYSAMFRIIRRCWFFGSGLGVDSLKRNVLFHGVYYASFPFVHAHSILLELWGESGVLAPLSFIPAMYFPFCAGTRTALRETAPVLRATAVGCACGLVGAMFFGLMDYAWSFPRVMFLFWFMFGLLLTAIKLSGKGCVLHHD